MPKRTDIHKILIIGSGPIVIGQAVSLITPDPGLQSTSPGGLSDRSGQLESGNDHD